MTFFFLVTFMLLVFLRPQDWLFLWLSGWNILDVVAVCATSSFVVELNAGQTKMPKNQPQFYLVLGLFFTAVLSNMVHGYFQGVIETADAIWKICFVTALMFCVLDRTSRLRGVAWVFVLMACMMSVHALMQERLGYGFIREQPLWIRATPTRPAHTRSLFFGIFSDPNDLAQILATSIPFAFVLFKRKSFMSMVVGCGISWFLIEAILSTHSRGGMVALVVVCAVFIILILPIRWFPYLMSALVIAALILCPLSAGFLDMSAHERFVFWGYANQAFKHNLLFGIGYGAFWTIAEDSAAHNAFVLCYTELGFLGYWCWFGLMQLGILGAWRTRIVLGYPENPEQAWLRSFAGMSIAAMLGFSASAYFLSRAFVYPMFFLFVILGVLPHVAKKHLPEDFDFVPYDFRKDVLVWVSIGAFVSILYIYFSILLLNIAWGGVGKT